ncbi:MAG: hypothetical protein J0I06_14410 [Planctomycetes bacterium]|nr:hypothetical protein [Planctomycetota bacterium]
MTTSRRAFVVLVCAAAVGCGGSGGISAPKTAPVSGTVLVKGKPAAGVKVTFHPQFDMGAVKFTPNGETNKEGRFTLNTAAAGTGAPPGGYAVTFELLRGGTDKNGQDVEVDVWKGKYADPARSSFKVTIEDGDNALEPFKLD